MIAIIRWGFDSHQSVVFENIQPKPLLLKYRLLQLLKVPGGIT